MKKYQQRSQSAGHPFLGAGCACPSERYFVLTKIGTGAVDANNNHDDFFSGSKGAGVTDGVRVWAFCLEGGEYSISAFDVLGEGW